MTPDRAPTATSGRRGNGNDDDAGCSEQHLHKDLTLAEIAAVVYMTVAPAGAFLATRELSIARIALLVEFRTQSHFTAVFRRVTGVTPKGYRTDHGPEDRVAGARRDG